MRSHLTMIRLLTPRPASPFVRPPLGRFLENPVTRGVSSSCVPSCWPLPRPLAVNPRSSSYYRDVSSASLPYCHGLEWSFPDKLASGRFHLLSRCRRGSPFLGSLFSSRSPETCVGPSSRGWHWVLKAKQQLRLAECLSSGALHCRRRARNRGTNKHIHRRISDGDECRRVRYVDKIERLRETGKPQRGVAVTAAKGRKKEMESIFIIYSI